jgi:hypothetical protein
LEPEEVKKCDERGIREKARARGGKEPQVGSEATEDRRPTESDAMVLDGITRLRVGLPLKIFD